ncbi:MAG: hypothetical protein R2839_05170 [Thermomicrobiales bacterium]
MEASGDVRLIWSEEPDGTRRLLNYEQIREGFAAIGGDLEGRRTLVPRQRRTGQAGERRDLGRGSGPHGVVRTTSPERSTIRMSDGEGVRPHIGSGWSGTRAGYHTRWWGVGIFQRLADKGSRKDMQLLYASHFDPGTGQWTAAEQCPRARSSSGRRRW